MGHFSSVRQQLLAIEQLLRELRQWQSGVPDEAAFASTQPFFMDTMQPVAWLQWVLIPRLHALLDGGHPLPEAFAVTPYYEMALEPSHAGREDILAALTKLDALFNE